MKSTMISQVNVEAGLAASLPIETFSNPFAARGLSLLMTLVLALLLIPAAQRQLKAQAIEPEYIPLTSSQLDQLVAPIALDPDPLVAQILIGSTFPDQVNDANNWVGSKLTLSPDQRATAANSMSWDPSIKGLVVFPVVLDSMAKNTAWTTQLGNAYYNQPDDVTAAIQAMRSLAFQSHVLVTTVQENVVVDAELIEILPANPDLVFVQYYDPWVVFGAEVAAFPGYVVEPAPAGVVVADGVSFEPGVSAGLDLHFGFSFGGWAPGWSGGGVAYNHNAYYSNSRTVANRDHFGRHDGRAFEHGPRGVQTGFHPHAYGNPARRTPFNNPASHRISSQRPGSLSHPGMAKPSFSGNRNRSSNLSSTRNTGRTTNMARNTNPGRNTNSTRNTAVNHGSGNSASRNASPRAASMNRHSEPSRPATTGRSLNANNGMNRSATTSRSGAPNRSIASNRPAASPSTRPANTFAGNRPASNPSAASNSVRGNSPMNRPAAGGNSMGANHATSRPASMTRTGGFGGGHVGKR